jgi:hypothetical protein
VPFSELNRIVSKGLKLIQYKDGLPLLNKVEIKYGREGFEERNNFLHRNFFIFEMGFELKFGKFNISF